MQHDAPPSHPPALGRESLGRPSQGRESLGRPAQSSVSSGREPELGRPTGAGPMPQDGIPFRPYPLEFTGNTGDYFRIWIVNLALSVITLGVFWPWARVRQQAYLYGHTRLSGHGFEYTADPKALLGGYLLAGGLFVIFNLSFQFADQHPWLLGVVLLLALAFFLLYPWLIMKAMRFTAYNSRYRNVRFGFDGDAQGAYGAYMGGNMLAGITSGLALPVAWFWQRSYQFKNLRYGRTRVNFHADLGEFYLIGLKAFGLYLLALLTLGLVLALMGLVASVVLLPVIEASGNEEAGALAILAAGAGVYLLVILAGQAAWQYANGAILKYVMERSNLGGVLGFSSTLSEGSLAWIGVSNTAAQVLTLGLATPWATVRRQRYITDNLTVMSQTDLDSFIGSGRAEQDALGEAASDIFGLEIGL